MISIKKRTKILINEKKAKERYDQNKTNIECERVYQRKKTRVEKKLRSVYLAKIEFYCSQRVYHLLSSVTDTKTI
jgi:hypothetical protein